ncbi:MAG TPA: allophanate hydrolase [Cellvibrionaceae bacterium]
MHNLSLAVLKHAYQSGQTTPRTLLLDLHQQAQTHSDKNIFITLLSETDLLHYIEAIEAQDPASLPLYGVPFAIKDNLDLANFPTTAACPAFAYTAKTSAHTVQLLINAGAIPLGKTNLDQFATGLNGTRSPYGQVPNAFLPEYISGGSSSGSAVATALGLVSFALGTDTAGSGRVPAALNNLVGVKPSKGLLSNVGLVPACRSLDCVSIFALNCDDAAYLFDLLAQYDPQDPYARPNPHGNRHRYFPSHPATFAFGLPQLELNPEAQTLFKQATDHLIALGGTPVPIDFSPFLSAARLLYQGPWISERKLATQAVASSDMLSVIQDIIVNTPEPTASQAFEGLYKLTELKRQCDAILAQVDLIITPAFPRAFIRAEIDADPIATNSSLGTYTNFMNLLDYAALALPAGTHTNGLPYGITLFGPAFSDMYLLSIGREFHLRTGLPQGATAHPLPNQPIACAKAPSEHTDVLVCGAHLAGEPLNWQLLERGASLKATTHTASGYRLYTLPDDKRPALVRDPSSQSQIAVEIWRVPTATLGSFLTGIAAPLGLGQVQIEDGSWVTGFICEPIALDGARDISEFGGWRAWKASL